MQKNTVKILILWNIITIQNNCFLFLYIFNSVYFCDGKVEFSSVITPVFNVKWFFRNQTTFVLLNISFLTVLFDE